MRESVQVITVHASRKQYNQGGKVASERNRQTVSFEELAYSNMLTLNALVELLTEKGLLSRLEILERVKQLQTQTQVKKKPH